jgi:protein involved in polysaccharide export with SLBB domain
MEVCERWSLAWGPALRWPALLLGLVVGCATMPRPLDEALLADKEGASSRHGGVVDSYHVACPDVLEVRVAGNPQCGGRREVGPDGCVELAGYGRLRAEGATIPEISQAVAERLHLPPAWVEGRVVEYRSQHIYLFGEVAGLQRAVAYQGPETVLDLLQRTGGVTPGAAPGKVYVVRSGVIEGQPPRIFHIDLAAIVRQQDQRTNIRLQPCDRVYIGETHQATLAKCFPQWLRPLYEALSGLSRHGSGQVTK